GLGEESGLGRIGFGAFLDGKREREGSGFVEAFARTADLPGGAGFQFRDRAGRKRRRRGDLHEEGGTTRIVEAFVVEQSVLDLRRGPADVAGGETFGQGPGKFGR